MATLKRLEKRMNDVESWVKDFNKGSGPAQTMDILNWLVGQTKQLGERLSMTEQQGLQLQNALEQNAKIVEQFIEQQELVVEWQSYLAELQKENEDAVQEQETESVPVRDEPEASEGVREENAETEETTE